MKFSQVVLRNLQHSGGPSLSDPDANTFRCYIRCEQIGGSALTISSSSTLSVRSGALSHLQFLSFKATSSLFSFFPLSSSRALSDSVIFSSQHNFGKNFSVNLTVQQAWRPDHFSRRNWSTPVAGICTRGVTTASGQISWKPENNMIHWWISQVLSLKRFSRAWSVSSITLKWHVQMSTRMIMISLISRFLVKFPFRTNLTTAGTFPAAFVGDDGRVWRWSDTQLAPFTENSFLNKWFNRKVKLDLYWSYRVVCTLL